MPELNDVAVHKFWGEYPDPMIYRVIAFMEGVEGFLDRDSPDFEATLAKLGQALDQVSSVNFNEFAEQDLQIAIITQLKTGTALRLLHSLDVAHPGAASKLLMYAEENSFSPEDNNSLFLRRNIVFERLRLMARIFSPERFALVRKALEGGSHE